MQRVGVAEAAKLDRGDRFTQDSIIERECPNASGTEREICEQDIMNEARTVYAEMRDRITPSAELLDVLSPSVGVLLRDRVVRRTPRATASTERVA